MGHESPASGFDEIPMDDIGFGNQWAWRRLLQWKKSPKPVGLIALMAYMGHHEVSKHQDRVYGLLGICSAADRAIVGDPNYTIPVEEVYTRLVVDWIRRHQSLNIVCFGALFTKPRSEELTGLPSWVPDFRCWVHAASRPVPSMVSEPSRDEIGNFRPFKNRKHGVVDPNLVYDASAGLVAEFSKDEHMELERGLRLPCKGIFLDIIDGLGRVREYESDGTMREYSDSTFIQSTSRVNTESRDAGGDVGKFTGSNVARYDVSQHLVRCLSLDRAGRYLIWPAPVEDYVNQLRERRLNPVPAHPDHLDKFIAANRELCILGASLQEHLKDLGSRPHASETPDGEWRCFAEASKMTAGERPWDCRLITTDQGRLGMAPKQAIKGDIVAVLIGCSVPVVIRGLKEGGGYKVVGEAFMPDYMQGEAIHQDLERKDVILV